MSRLLSYCGHCRQSAKPRLCREPDTGIGRTIACLAIALHDLAEEPAIERDRLGLVELTARVAVIEDVQHLEFVDISGRQFGAGFQIVRVIVWDGWAGMGSISTPFPIILATVRRISAMLRTMCCTPEPNNQ
jgi:hypothetical protein